MAEKPSFLNFTVDHMTLLLHPKLYTIAYAVFRIIFGTQPEDLLYEKRRAGKNGKKDVSMTFATRVGQWNPKNGDPLNTIFAIVQPSEPADEPSHVRSMLDGHEQVAHWQHIALRTPDLISFHRHALERGVQFVTPILKDDHDNLIQVFSGEWYFPGSKPSGLFFEFLQRDPSEGELAEIQKSNKQTWFRDETFLGLYGEKEKEYQSGKVVPFVSDELFNALSKKIGDKQVWDITEAGLGRDGKDHDRNDCEVERSLSGLREHSSIKRNKESAGSNSGAFSISSNRSNDFNASEAGGVDRVTTTGSSSS